jgi:hypothetical protein
MAPLPPEGRFSSSALLKMVKAKMEAFMKKLVVPALFLSLALGGCASTGFMGFLATTEYVDKKLAAEEEKARAEQERQKAETERIAQELKEVLAVKEQAAGAAEQAARAVEQAVGASEQAAGAREAADSAAQMSEETKKALEELEAKLAALPEETLRKLIDIIQASLSQEEAAAE